MRAKTETRRQAILDAAAEVFQEPGFERTTMAAICERLGYSKATLYNYFASKGVLFSEVMFAATDTEFAAVHDALDQSTEDIAQSLREFGERFLAFIYSPRIRAERHLAISESGRTELGRLVYERGVQRSQRLIAGHLESAMAQGKLRPADAFVATQHLHSLLEAELLEPFLHQQLGEVTEKQIGEITERAIDVFMAAYGPRSERRG